MTPENTGPVAVVYSDSGPGGPCGQDFVTTSAHTQVFLFDDEEVARVAIRDGKITHRRGRRWSATIVYPEGHPNHTRANALFNLCTKTLVPIPN